MKKANLDVFKAAGMIDDENDLSEEAFALIDRLTPEEIEQLIAIWKRLGKPKPPIGHHSFIY
ncbi:MAG: hypothetical protein AAGC60_13315 [Acidobacteriota bacterium]